MPVTTLRQRSTLLSVAISTILASNLAIAAENSSSQYETIESIVVVGATTNTEVSPAELERQQANDLADIFRHIPSVNVGGSLGIAQKIYIRGMEDTLLNITVDGAPQTSTLFHHIGRVSIEPELLQRVEIQAGAGEATSGAGAIGGSIRFQTVEASDLLSDEQQFGGFIKTSYFSNNGRKASASLYGKLNENWGILASLVHVDRENMEDGHGDELFGTAATQSLAFAKISGRISDSQHLTISYEQREEAGDFGARPNWPTLEGDTLFPLDTQRDTFVINHQFTNGEDINLETTFYHTESEIVQDRYDRWGKYRGASESNGFDIRNTSYSANHELIYGLDLRKDTVKSEYLAPQSVWAGWAWDPNQGVFIEEGQVFGAYIQDHWQVNDALLLSFGLRYDNYELDQVTVNDNTSSNDLSPNLGLSYQFSDSVKLTIGHAQAVRGKEVGDTFTIESEPGVPSIDANLQAESVDNTELGLEYNNESYALKASIYQSTINDVIYDQQGGGVFYENVGKLETQGFELMAEYQWNNLTLTGSYSNNDTELNGNTVEGYEHNGLGGERGNTWNINADYSFSPNLELGWNFTYVQDLNDIEVLHRSVELGWIASTQIVNKPGYKIHDLYLKWLPLGNDSLALNVAVQNVFDKHYRDHSSIADYNHIPGWGVAGLYEAGRDLRVSVNYRF